LTVQREHRRSWATPLGTERSTAIAVARDVAARTTDRNRLRGAIVSASRQTAFPEAFRWEPYGIAEGDAGLALMCGYVDACLPGERWDATAHEFMAVAARAGERVQFLPAGIFSGVSGLAFATSLLGREGTRYQRLLRALEDALLPRVAALADALKRAPNGIAVSHFDAISGLSGVGAYLLRRRARREMRATLEGVLTALVELTMPAGGPPRWHTPANLLGDEAMAREFPYGNLNCGLAHGIPGPLTLMALALCEGVEVRGQADAVRRTCDWLVAHRADDEWGVSWPTAVPLGPAGGREPDPPILRPSRSAWCYGSPGVARSLWLAGEALSEPALRSLAVEAMEAVYRRPMGARNIDSPTFCHGVAGLLQITLRFAHDTGLAVFADATRTLVEQLLAAYRPDRPLGYYSLEPGDNPVDRPGVLDGASGVAMVLLAAATDTEPSWDRLFLLS
jgi:hypothetical protein